MVTGASSGIGAAVAHALVHEGAHVALAARRRHVLLDVQAGLEEPGGMAKSLVAATEILVNCAGIMYYILMLFSKYTTR